MGEAVPVDRRDVSDVGLDWQDGYKLPVRRKWSTSRSQLQYCTSNEYYSSLVESVSIELGHAIS
jgi:hypothetical protein